MEGTKWVGNLLLTSFIFCGPLFATFAVNNTVAIAYGVSAGAPVVAAPAAAWEAVGEAWQAAREGRHAPTQAYTLWPLALKRSPQRPPTHSAPSPAPCPVRSRRPLCRLARL